MDRHTCEYPSRNDAKGLESTSRVFGSDFKRLVDKVFGVQTRSYTSLSPCMCMYVCVCIDPSRMGKIAGATIERGNKRIQN